MKRVAAEPRVEAVSELPDIVHPSPLGQRMKKVTSGSENRQRTKSIRVRVFPADAARLKIEAAGAGMSVAAYLASGRLGNEAADPPRLSRRPVTVDGVALMQALVAFNRARPANLNGQMFAFFLIAAEAASFLGSLHAGRSAQVVVREV